jgi:hypothetical protein
MLVRLPLKLLQMTLTGLVIHIITKYVFSIDGKPGPNHYNDVWIPWAMKSPLLAYLGIFSSACYQAEAQRSSPEKAALALGYKTKSLRLLNEMLSDPKLATSNEAIGAVVNIMITEWYWNNHEVVKQHMEGLVQIIKLKGGLDELGPGHCLREMILTYVTITTNYLSTDFLKYRLLPMCHI